MSPGCCGPESIVYLVSALASIEVYLRGTRKLVGPIICKRCFEEFLCMHQRICQVFYRIVFPAYCAFLPLIPYPRGIYYV